MVSLLFAFALLAAEPAVQAEARPEAAPAPAPAAPAVDAEDERVVCVSESQMGSHFKKKTCRTKAEWKKRREKDKAAADRALDIVTTDHK